MANRLFNPDIQYFDAIGTTPLAGGKLFFYSSGTSTKLNTYSNAGLTSANANPVELDSAGRAGPIFLQNLQYKVVLAPADDTDPPTAPIWTQDPVYTSDYSAAAQFSSGNGSPNGVVAGNAGTDTILASAYWDYANNILYICTTTGTAVTAVWTAINAATAANVVPAPQGYLTLISDTPIITTDVVAATTVYYTPYIGDDVPVYNGTSFVPLSIVSELQLMLVSSHVASNIYDFFVFNNSGVVTLGTGPSWSAGTGGSITAGSCVRGTGTGGAALTYLQGVLTNAVSMTMRYGDGTQTVTVAPNLGTYVGSLFVDGTNGQVSCYRSYGQNRKWGIWNAYNRAPIYMKAGDATASWPYALTTVRASNGSSANSITVFTGLAEEIFDIRRYGTANGSDNSVTYHGIGWNSTTAFSGNVGRATQLGATSGTSASGLFLQVPSLGINVVTALEGNGTAAGVTYFGGEDDMLLSASYNG